MFYTIFACGDEDGNKIAFTASDDIEDKDFHEGQKFSSDPDAESWEKAPEGITKLTIKKGREKAPLPSFLSQPVPLMSKGLVDALKNAGVNNIDAYEAELYYASGKLASKDYFLVNIVGVIAAADLGKSVYDENQKDRSVTMSFDALSVDDTKTYGALMFRLAENITTIVVREEIKDAIEAANIPYLETTTITFNTWFR